MQRRIEQQIEGSTLLLKSFIDLGHLKMGTNK